MQNNLTKEKFTNILSIIFLSCLGVLAFYSIFSVSIFGFDLGSFYIGELLFGFLDKIQYGLVIFAIVSGSLIFYVNKDKIESIEAEQEKEVEEEERKKKEFVEKFPRLSKIPVLGWLVKWGYKEGWRYSIGLIGIILLGLILRYIQLDYYDFFRDEFGTLGNAKIAYLGGDIEYKRTYLLTIFYEYYYKIFGFSTDQFFNNIPFLFFSVINAFLIYLIGKKLFNKITGFFLMLIFYLSLYSINISTYIREYEFNLLLSLTLIYIILKTNLKIQIIFTILYLIYLINDFKTGGTLIVGFPIIFSLVIGKNYKNIISLIVKYKKIIILLITSISLILFYFHNYWFWLFNKLRLKFDYVNYVTFKSLDLGNIQYLLVFLSIIGFIFLLFNRKINKINIFYALGILLLTIYYYLFFSSHFAPRYSYLLFGLSIFFYGNLIIYISKNRKIYIGLLIFIIFTLLGSYIYYYLDKPYSNFNKYMGTYAYKNSDLVNFLKNKGIDKEINKNIPIITTNGGEVLFYVYEGYEFKVTNKKYGYVSPKSFDGPGDYTNYSKDYINIINNQKMGYIIIDYIRRGWFGIPKESFYVNDKYVDFIGNIEGYYIYKWY